MKTVEFLTLGSGIEDGSFGFDPVLPTGVKEQRTFPFSYTYLHVSIAIGGTKGPYVSLVTNHITSALPRIKRVGGYLTPSF